MLHELTELAQHAYVSPQAFAWIYQGLGDMESWRKTMHACLEERSGLLALLYAPYYDSVRSDPFFQELVRNVGLP